jgi:hypothetical protein
MAKKVAIYAKVRYSKTTGQYSIGIPKHIKAMLKLYPKATVRVEIEPVK